MESRTERIVVGSALRSRRDGAIRIEAMRRYETKRPSVGSCEWNEPSEHGSNSGMLSCGNVTGRVRFQNNARQER